MGQVSSCITTAKACMQQNEDPAQPKIKKSEDTDSTKGRHQRQNSVDCAEAERISWNKVWNQEATPFRKCTLGRQGTCWFSHVGRIWCSSASLQNSWRAGVRAILSTALQWHIRPSFHWRLTTTSISLHGLSTQFTTASVKTGKITGKNRACHLATRGQACAVTNH